MAYLKGEPQLQYSAWIKGQNITAKNTEGAGIFAQSYDVNGEYISGSFPPTRIGTFDWTRVGGEYHVPANAAKLLVGLYLRKNAVGEVWFDDVEAHFEPPIQFFSFLKNPNYRGLVKAHDNTPWQMGVELNPQPDWKAGTVQITTHLMNAEGKQVASQSDSVSSQEKVATITFKRPADLPQGEYRLQQRITNPNGQVVLEQNFPIRVTDEMPRVHIDGKGFTVVDGKRFFPLGIYTGSYGSTGGHRINSESSDLQRMANAGFNTVLSYSYAARANVNGTEFLDIARQHNLQVIYSLKDMYDGHGGYPQNGLSGQASAQKHIDATKGHPALLAWYINDEMADGWLEPIQRRYDQLLNFDPNHPAYTVSNKPGFNRNFFPMTDVLGSDPYPVGYPDKSLNHVTDWTHDIQSAGRDAKGIWQVLQIHNAKHHKIQLEAQPPTLEQMRNMSYQALVNGTKGLMYFAYHWLFFDIDESGKRIYSEAAFQKRWPDIVKLIEEIKPLTGIVLQDEKVNLQKLNHSTVQYQAWQSDGKLYLMVVNAATDDKPASLALQLPVGWRLSPQQVPGVQARQHGDRLQIELAPIASGTLALER
jgi:hypothetical protein